MSKVTTAAAGGFTSTNAAKFSIVKMNALAILGRTALLDIASSANAIGKAAFVTTAKVIVCVENSLKGNETKFSVLRSAGFRDSDIKNGSQLARVWEEFVEPGHISEDRFDELTFRDAVHIHAAAKARGKDIVRSVMNTPKWSEELDCLADHGQTLTERKDAEAARKAKEVKAAAEKAEAAKKAEADAATPEVEPPTPEPKGKAKPATSDPAEASPEPSAGEETAGAGETPPDATPAPAKAKSAQIATVSSPAPGKGQSAKVNEFRKLMAAAEAIGLDIISSGTEADIEGLRTSLEGLAVTLRDAINASIGETAAA